MKPYPQYENEIQAFSLLRTREGNRVTGLKGIRVVEVGGAAAMPLAGMLMGTWGTEIIHLQPWNHLDVVISSATWSAKA